MRAAPSVEVQGQQRAEERVRRQEDGRVDQQARRVPVRVLQRDVDDREERVGDGEEAHEGSGEDRQHERLQDRDQAARVRLFHIAPAVNQQRAERQPEERHRDGEEVRDAAEEEGQHAAVQELHHQAEEPDEEDPDLDGAFSRRRRFGGPRHDAAALTRCD